MKKCYAAIFVFVIGFGFNGKAQVVTIGPMLHLNFSKEVYFSFGIEAAIWVFPGSVDAGLEFGIGKKGGNYRRRYIELQTLLPSYGGMEGYRFNGISAGYVFEKNIGAETTSHGFQASIWSVKHGGVDLRMRIVGGVFSLSPGGFIKLPIPFMRITT